MDSLQEPRRHDPPRSVDADDIAWVLEPPPAAELVDLLTLTDSETLGYARELQRECRTLRLLLHEALALVARLTARLRYRR